MADAAMGYLDGQAARGGSRTPAARVDERSALGRAMLMAAVLAGLLSAASVDALAGSRHQRSEGEPGKFDYYALALSWSPAYCALHDDPGQCTPGQQAGFVLHGLWPQYTQGYPESCSTERLSAADRARYSALYPSPKLIAHEWSRHGTCSGLPPASYFALSARLRQQVAIPAAYQRPTQPVRVTYDSFVGAFRAANPRLPDDAVLPFCSAGGRVLKEIHACFDKGGAAMRCGQAEVRRSHNTCRQDSFLLQSVR